MIIFLEFYILKIIPQYLMMILLDTFFSPPFLREEINQTCEAKIFALNWEDPTYEARKKYFERKMEEELDAINSFEKNKRPKKRKFQLIEYKITDCQDPR